MINEKIAIIVDDITRSAPSHMFLSPSVKRFETAGIKDEDITFLFVLYDRTSLNAGQDQDLIRDTLPDQRMTALFYLTGIYVLNASLSVP